jgi:rubrerythrin
MSLDSKLQPFQVLAAAIASEIDAVAFYTKLQERVKNIILLQKLKFLAFEEEQHRRMLQKLFGQRFADKPFEVPDESLLPKISASIGDDPPVADLFKAALDAEEAAEAFYERSGRAAEDEGSRRLLAYLSRVERSHAAMIRSEIDMLVKYPDYYVVEDFHIGQDLFHVGP